MLNTILELQHTSTKLGTQLANNTESNGKRLGGIFLIVGWIAILLLVAALINHSLFSTKNTSIRDTDAGKEITIYRGYDSHFRIKGSINGVLVTFLVDTGASSLAVSSAIATRANLTHKSQLITETAGGNSIGYFTIIDKLTIADLELNKVSAVIIPDMAIDEALLGMNVLQKFNITQNLETLILTVPPQS